MTHKIWRLEVDAPELESGAATHIRGADAEGDPLDALVYCASTQSLAIIEGAVRLTLPREVRRRLVEFSVPQDVWLAREHLDDGQATGRSHLLGRRRLRMALSSWSGSSRSVLLTVPSWTAPDEWIVIFNRRHADASRITARAVASGHYV